MSFPSQLPVLLLALAAVSCLAAADDIFFTPCTKFGYQVVVKKVELHPDPAIAGEELKFRITASSQLRIIRGGEVQCRLVGPNSELEKTESLCNVTKCPVTRGKFVLTGAHTLAANSSPGKYTLTMRVIDTRGLDLSCVRIRFTVKEGTLAVVEVDGDEEAESMPFVF